MSVRTAPFPGDDETRDLRKQLGCMNGIFQLFDRRHFLTGRRHRHKSLLLLERAQQPQEDHRVTQIATRREKGTEGQKEKPRTSTESSRASCSSSTCSTSSSFDCNRMARPEGVPSKQINGPDHMGSRDLRDVVKGSVYREVPNGLSVETRAGNERRGKVMKHIDSPRPLFQFESEKPKAGGYNGSGRVHVKVPEGIRSSKGDRLTLPRLSYDGRESRETVKWGSKHKDHPRLSLDSKTSSMKYSALESRSNFLVRDLNIEHDGYGEVPAFNQESGSHRRSSSLVTKLMGLEGFPDMVSTTPTLKPCPKEEVRLQLSTSACELRKPDGTQSPRVLQNSPTSMLSGSGWKPRFPTESAPWRRQECSQRTSSHRKATATGTARLSLSVYGEIQKRVDELEFKKSGKDLRALKQILDAMEKTRERLEIQRGEAAEAASTECSWSDHNSNLSQPKDGQVVSIQHRLGSPVVIMKPARTMDRFNTSYSAQFSAAQVPPLRRIQTQDRERKPKDHSPKNNDRMSERQRQRAVESCTPPGRSSGTLSPRLQHNVLRTGLPRPAKTSLSDSRDVKKCHGKKIVEKGPQNRKTKVRAKDLQMSDDQLSELSSETRYSSYQGDTASVKSESNNSLVSMTETEIISPAHSTSVNSAQKKNYTSRARKHMPAGDGVVTTVEQPSPISVLDDAFYCEDSPSPVKKTSTAFRDDVPSPVEVEWRIEDQKHLTESRFNHGCKYDMEIEGMRHPIRELNSLHDELDAASANCNALAYRSHNPDHVYINKVLSTSGLLRDSTFVTAATNQLLSSYHLINPDMFHVIEQTEDSIHGEKNEKRSFDKKIQRKIIFDMVDEILVRKISASRFAIGKKATNPQVLLEEIYIEMDRVRQFSTCSIGNEEDVITRLLTADMKCRPDDWADYKGEVPALVLDVERLIFKDLINEVVTREMVEVGDLPKRPHRQLFRK